MTQLLISVKNVQEALLALHAGADVIDLKDPNVGALGALDFETTAQILQAIDGRVVVSATVGEGHKSLSQLLQDIQVRAELGVDIIKIVVSELFYQPEFATEIRQFTKNGIKIVTVFFGDEEVDLALLTTLQQAGFYGAMLDTKTKRNPLTDHQSENALVYFINQCSKNNLFSGLAGSLKPQHIEYLAQLKPAFIGLRGGVCENDMRKSILNKAKVVDVKNMLLRHNKMLEEAQKSLNLVLYS